MVAVVAALEALGRRHDGEEIDELEVSVEPLGERRVVIVDGV